MLRASPEQGSRELVAGCFSLRPLQWAGLGVRFDL
jgi:hypothetical protein